MIVLFVFLFCLIPLFVQASSLYRIRDLLESSHPATATDHTIDFTVGQSVPPDGRITIDFEPGSVNMPGSFNVADMDLSVATSGNDHTDRQIGSSATGTVDGISLTTGTSAGITVDINPTFGIDAGHKVRLELGQNASYQATSSQQIINASQAGVYGIQINTYDHLNSLLDNGKTFIVMIDPTNVSSTMPRMRYNGKPDGVLAAGTTMTIMSLTTNYDALCRFSSSTPVLYEHMTKNFNSSDSRYHTYILTGLVPGQFYTFYVRCYDPDEGIADDDDYIIDFSIAVSGEGGTGGGEGGGEGDGDGDGGTGGSGGGTGGGSGGGGGGGTGSRRGTKYPYPEDEEIPPDVSISGWAYPSSQAFILKEGERYDDTMTGADGRFQMDISDLSKGIYTFGIWVRDPDGNRSLTYTSTFWVEEDTQTNVANILIPPTLKLTKNSVDKGGNFDVSGYSTPGKKVEVQVYRPDVKGVTVRQADVAQDGSWRILFPTNELPEGKYKMRAKTIFEDLGSSIYSQVLDCGVGEAAEEDNCARSDINKDGSVNLVDFSIMLFNWGTANADSDINSDGTVNLVDFSIMLFCWTG